MSNYRSLTLTALILVSFLPDAGAQESPGNDYSNDLDIYSRYIPSRLAQEQSGSVGIIESEFNYDYNLKAFGQLPVDFSINSRYFDIDNSTKVALPSHLTGFTAGIETTVPFFELNNTYFHFGVFPTFNGDNWTFDSADFRIPSKYYIIYKLNDQWAFVGGVAVFPDYDSTVSPIAGFIYKPNDKLIFYLVPDRPNISYALTDKVTLFAEGWYKNDDEYIVTRDATDNVTLRYAEGHLGTGVRYKVNKYTVITLSGGAVFMNSLKYLDGNGKVVLENGPYVELRVQVKI